MQCNCTNEVHSRCFSNTGAQGESVFNSGPLKRSSDKQGKGKRACQIKAARLVDTGMWV